MAVLKKALFSAILMASCAAAAPYCTTLATLQDYVAQGAAGCQLGDKLFSNFSYAYLAAGNTSVAASAVNVTTTISGDMLDYALTFTGNWTSVGLPGQAARTSDITINFDIAAPAALPMVSTSLSLSGQIFYQRPTGVLEQIGRISATEGYTGNGGVNGSVPGLSITTSLAAPNSAVQTLASTGVFSQPVTNLHVSKDIALFSGGSTNSALYNNPNYLQESVSLLSFSEAFHESEIPEPAVFLTFGGGLILLSIAGRYRARLRGTRNVEVTKKYNNKTSEAL